MNDPFARMMQLNDPVFAPLRREDLPSFVVALPQGELVAATQACSSLGLTTQAPLPEEAAETARRIAAHRDEAPHQARILLPLSPEPQLFSCRAILTPAGQFVMFADPRSLSTPAAGNGAVQAQAGSASVRPARFTWEVDAGGRLTQLSEGFRTPLGITDWQGRRLVDLLSDLGFAGTDALAAAMNAQVSFSDVGLEGRAGRVRLGGVPLFSPTRTLTGARGFGQVWVEPAPAREVAEMPGLAAEDSAPPVALAPKASTSDLQHAHNVVPIRGGNLSPRERTAFHEIARTLHDAIDSWQKTGEPAPLPEADEPPSPPPSLVEPAEAEDGVLDRLPLGVVVHQHGELVRVNRTLLSWCGDADMAAFEAAGGLTPRLSRPDAVKPLSLRTRQGVELPVEVRVVTATWGNNPALVHVVRRLDDAPATESASAATALQRTLDLIPVGIVLLARSGAMEESNETLGRYAGFSRADLRGEPFTSLFAPESQSRAVLLLDEAALQVSAHPCTATLTLRSRAGADTQMMATLARVESETPRYCLVLRPAAERAAAALPYPLAEGSRADALDTPQARATVDALARRMSHAIRTPLTSILGFVDAVRASTFGPVGNVRYAKHAEAAQTAGQQLLALLEDVEHLFPTVPSVDTERVDLRRVVDAALGHLDDMVKRRRILVRREGPDSLLCLGRKASLEHILRLLLEEAIRATPVSGQVMVSLRKDGDRVRLRVRDGGDALSEVEIAQAFDLLAKAPVSNRFSTAGRPFRFARLSGIVRAEGGDLSLQPGMGGGMLVDLSLPA